MNPSSVDPTSRGLSTPVARRARSMRAGVGAVAVALALTALAGCSGSDSDGAGKKSSTTTAATGATDKAAGAGTPSATEGDSGDGGGAAAAEVPGDVSAAMAVEPCALLNVDVVVTLLGAAPTEVTPSEGRCEITLADGDAKSVLLLETTTNDDPAVADSSVTGAVSPVPGLEDAVNSAGTLDESGHAGDVQFSIGKKYVKFAAVLNEAVSPAPVTLATLVQAIQPALKADG